MAVCRRLVVQVVGDDFAHSNVLLRTGGSRSTAVGTKSKTQAAK